MRYRIPLLFSIAFIMCSQLTNGLLTPALPSIRVYFGVDEHQVQQIMVLFILSLGISQLFYGPLADAYGRRFIFWLGQSVFLLGNAICLMGLADLQWLLVGVFFQGLGAGSNQILARCLLSDSYEGKALSNNFALLGIAASIVPVIGPVLGGLVTHNLGWQWLFVLIGIGSTGLILLAAPLMPETQTGPRASLRPSGLANSYLGLLRQPVFISTTQFTLLTSGGIMYMMASAPFVLQDGFDLTADQFGLYMILPAIGMAAGGFAKRILSSRLDDMDLLKIASVLPLISAVFLVNATHPLPAVIAFSLNAAATGIIYPLVQGQLFARFRQQAGIVSALSGALQMGFTAAAVALGTRLMPPTQGNLTLVFAGLSLTLLLLCLLPQPKPMAASDVEAV